MRQGYNPQSSDCAFWWSNTSTIYPTCRRLKVQFTRCFYTWTPTKCYSDLSNLVMTCSKRHFFPLIFSHLNFFSGKFLSQGNQDTLRPENFTKPRVDFFNTLFNEKKERTLYSFFHEYYIPDFFNRYS